MKALAIHQPFAELICRPQSQLPSGAVRKRCENRRWRTSYRGPLLIHAGKSLEWFDEEDWPPVPDVRKLTHRHFPDLAFGALIGIADVVNCVRFPASRLPEGYEWLNDHEHAEGPFCWILQDARKFEKPIPLRGQQGLFDVEMTPELREALACK